jgi:hypothetical protein
MAGITVGTTINTTPEQVWEVVRVVADHVDWMHDAVAIRFTSASTSGVGTTFDCDTKVGPFRLTDQMEITRWEDNRVMGVRHVGMVTGVGEFTLEPTPSGGTEFTWHETLHFPWWMGGPIGATVGGVFLRLIWKRNLRGLKAIAEQRGS